MQRLGVTVDKQNSSILAVLTMSSDDPRYDATYVSNYALLNVLDELKRTARHRRGAALRRAQLFHAHLAAAGPRWPTTA